MANHDIVTIGASAGGVEALMNLARPRQFRARAKETREHADHLRKFLLTLNQH